MTTFELSVIFSYCHYTTFIKSHRYTALWHFKLRISKNIAFLHRIWYNAIIGVDRMYLPGTSGEIIGDLRTARGLSDV